MLSHSAFRDGDTVPQSYARFTYEMPADDSGMCWLTGEQLVQAIDGLAAGRHYKEVRDEIVYDGVG